MDISSVSFLVSWGNIARSEMGRDTEMKPQAGTWEGPWWSLVYLHTPRMRQSQRWQLGVGTHSVKVSSPSYNMDSHYLLSTYHELS